MHESIGNKLSYVGQDAEGYSRYEFRLKDKLVFIAKAHKDEKDNPIYIAKANGIGWIKTNLRAFVADEGNGFDHITSDSMKDSIYGNMVFVLADLVNA